MLQKQITYSSLMRTSISKHCLCRLYFERKIIDVRYSLPGADRIAIKTGAIVIGNGEAINVLRAAGVPECQLMPVSGGERVPLFPGKMRQAAVLGEIERAPAPPGAPPLSELRLAVASVHVWPSLHCLMPGNSHAEVPGVMDTGKVRLPTTMVLAVC